MNIDGNDRNEAVVQMQGNAPARVIRRGQWTRLRLPSENIGTVLTGTATAGMFQRSRRVRLNGIRRCRNRVVTDDGVIESVRRHEQQSSGTGGYVER